MKVPFSARREGIWWMEKPFSESTEHNKLLSDDCTSLDSESGDADCGANDERDDCVDCVERDA